MNMFIGKDRFKLMLVRPPGHIWPLINESDNWLLPLGLPSIAAYLRREIRGIDIQIVDCLPNQMGWKSLERTIAEYRPDVFGVGDLLIYMYEGMRAISLAKKINPNTITIAGGHVYSHIPEYSLKNFKDLDYIVRYEGEETTCELLKTLRDGGDVSLVKSIAYRDGDRVVCTKLRNLIADLDSLPMPAYDLMPIDKYAPYGRLYHRAITIQGSRGCPYSCNYCAWTALECGHQEDSSGKITMIPSFRQRSVGRMLEDIGLLYHNYGIRYLFWVEGTWNYDNQWVDELCSEIIKRNYKGLGWWAFVRADKILEQEKLGILPKMVKAGFKHALIGGERPTEDELNEVGKNKLDSEALIKCSHLLRRKYPQVVRFSTFLTGIRSETPQSLLRLSDYSIRAKLDFAPFHPLTPFPGTALYDEATKNNWIEENDLSKFDMFTPVMPSKHLTRQEISHWTLKIQQRFVYKQPFHYLQGFFSPVALRRRLRWYLTFSILKVIARDFFMAIKGKKKFEGFGAIEKMWKPKWYDS
ncbi:MAG: cobalamin-dependent protein [Oligoflexia bacterium]|nr:cobalamin-dependent protein [Oligoflexia bacterium]